MSSSEDENIEIVEFYVGLLQEKCELFQKDKNPSPQKLNEFIAEYINLEDKIMKLMGEINVSTEENGNKMEELTRVFSIYWDKYQDKWQEDFWNVYDMYRLLNEKDRKNIISGIDSNKTDQSGMNNDNNMSSSKNRIRKVNKMNYSSLNKIDEDIEKVKEEDKKVKLEKKQSCTDLECLIF
jgi:hypothetical protein